MIEKKKDTSIKGNAIVNMLATASGKANKSRNRVLLGAIILSIISLTIVFGVSDKKIQTEYMQAVHRAGMTASAYLEKGTKEQYELIKGKRYIEQSGRSLSLGSAYEKNNKLVCQVKILDENAWQDIVSPAYGKITGTYPLKNDEIMFSERALDNMGMKPLKEGMEITLTIEIGLFRKETETFKICGWFEDYMEPSASPAIGYLSEEKLREWGVDFDENADILIKQKSRISWQELEKRIYEDIPMKAKTQNLTASDSYAYEVIHQFVGGYGMAFAGAMIILVGVYLLIYNVMRISMINDIRQIGLLNTLGATGKQLRQIYRRQIGRLIYQGSIIGGIVSFIVSKLLGIRLRILIFAILFSAGVIFVATIGIIRKAVRLSCVESMHYTESVKVYKQRKIKTYKRKRSEMQELFYMAWQNILRSKKQTIITISSLFLGLVTALGAIVIIEGSDLVHYYKDRPDFIVFGEMCEWSSKQEGYGNEYKGNEFEEDMLKTEAPAIALISDNYYEEFSPISVSVSQEIMNLEGVEKEDSYILEGAYMIPIFTEKGIRPMIEGKISNEDGAAEIEADWCIVQILNEEEIVKLSKYVEGKQLPIDMSSLENGTGALMLHDHILSPEQEKQAKESVGEPLVFKSFAPKKYMNELEKMSEDEQEDFEKQWDTQRSEKFKFCGYFDTAYNDFPPIRQTWHGSRLLYFAISEEGFAKLPTSKKILYMEINVETDEQRIKSAIQNILLKENQIRQKNEESGITYVSKSTVLSREEKGIQRNRLLLSCISIILIFVGLMNYSNVMVTGILTRKKDFSVMRNIGMTKKQQRDLLITEGACYCVLTGILILTVGTGVLWIIQSYMEKRVLYFNYTYPVDWILFLLICLCGICISVPLVIYKKLVE